MDLINYNDFAKVKLKVGRIISAEDIAGKDKLYLVKVDLGEEKPKTLFAGIKKYYSKEELAGKTVIVVANLESKRMGSVVSEGMLLAASIKEGDDEKIALLEPDKEMPSGADIY